MQEIPLEPYASLATAGAGKIAAFNVGADGHLYLALAEGPLDYLSVTTGGAGFPITTPAIPKLPDLPSRRRGCPPDCDRVRRAVQYSPRPALARRSHPAGLRAQQPPPDGVEQNGRLYSTDGIFVRGLTLGDGIQDVAVTPDGLIWTSYFDEGVFGNSGRDQSPCQSGLAAWWQDASCAYEFAPVDGLGHICDCYAMNACGNDIWVSYYTKFPLVHIRNGSIVRHLKIPVAGSDAFAIAGKYALFRGGYSRRNEYHLLTLPESEPAFLRSKFTLRDPDGALINAERAAGRGDTLFLLRGLDVFKITVGQAWKASLLAPAGCEAIKSPARKTGPGFSNS